MRWLSITESSPPLETPCVTNGDNYDMHFVVGKWDGKQWYACEDSCDYAIQGVTHFIVLDGLKYE